MRSTLIFKRYSSLVNALRIQMHRKHKLFKKEIFCSFHSSSSKTLLFHELKFSSRRFFFSNIKCQMRSTIFALSTSPGVSAVAVIRVSGPKASQVLFQMGSFTKLPTPRKAVLRTIKDPASKEPLDKSLILWFPAPNSFTGEDVCELHIHGGIAVIKSVLRALGTLSTFCPAEPGEFTRRAFLAEKLDLTEVEGLADLIHAQTEAQQKQALRQMDGVLSNLYNKWTDQLKESLALIEAYIDFSEDQHLDDHMLKKVNENIVDIQTEIKQLLQEGQKGEKLRHGVHAVLIGKPNVGKSSLLNAICKKNIAIVSPTAGTTRDIIESSINLDGYLVHLFDTAGIRESCDDIELEGVKRANKRSSEADILLFLVEAKAVIKYLSQQPKILNFSKYLMLQELGDSFLKKFCIVNEKTWKMNTTVGNHVSVLLVLNKIDLLSKDELIQVQALEDQNMTACAISCFTNKGMEKLISKFTEKVKNLCDFSANEEPTLTQERHRKYLENCLQSLSEYHQNFGYDVAIAAENIRSACNHIGKITGKITAEDILDVIFKNFCIGK